jgi:hypothetical protein
MTGYQCELCGTDRGNYAAMMACENECYAENVAARKNHVSPRVMRPAAMWDDE